VTRDEARYATILDDALNAAREKDYAGWSKFDALNSPFLDAATFGNKWLRLAAIQFVKESPVNLRPLFGVRKSRNPKGIALFARAYLTRFGREGRPEDLDETRRLLEWLLENPSPGFENRCWGYNYVWQGIPPFCQEKGEPNVVVTAFVGEALIAAYRATGEAALLEAARSAAEFMTRDLPVMYESATEQAVSYIPKETASIVLNVQAMSGAYLAKVAKETGERRYAEIAAKRVAFTRERGAEGGGWYYAHPREKYRAIDNYHTGGVVDAFREYAEETGDERTREAWLEGLDFYDRRLFEEDGAPRWTSDAPYPRDAHGSAQGILSFAAAGAEDPRRLERARQIADWAIDNLYRPKTRDFAYRKGRFLKWNYSLMRWCNGWMTRALAALLERKPSA
jgi:hypothetical protein